MYLVGFDGHVARSWLQSENRIGRSSDDGANDSGIVHEADGSPVSKVKHPVGRDGDS